MTGIALPSDRTLRNRITAFCRNPRCREESGKEFRFEVEHDLFACPKCGANTDTMVGVLVLIHLLIPDLKGPVMGSHGLRYKIACDAKRAYLATANNLEAVSDNPQAINCPECLAVATKLNITRPTSKTSLVPKD